MQYKGKCLFLPTLMRSSHIPLPPSLLYIVHGGDRVVRILPRFVLPILLNKLITGGGKGESMDGRVFRLTAR